MRNLIPSNIIRYICLFIASFNFLFFYSPYAHAENKALYQKAPSPDEHIAMTYFALSQLDPNFPEIAVQNLGGTADPAAGQSEINRLQKKLGETRPNINYIIIQDFTGFAAKQGHSGESLFVFPELNEEFFYTASYHQSHFMIAPKGIKEFHEIELSEDKIQQFLHSFDQSPIIAYNLHLRADYAARDKLTLEDEKQYNMISGDIAYLAFLDRQLMPVWEYKAPWYGQTIQTDLNTLYHKNGAPTSQEMRAVNDEIQSIYENKAAP